MLMVKTSFYIVDCMTNSSRRRAESNLSEAALDMEQISPSASVNIHAVHAGNLLGEVSHLGFLLLYVQHDE